MLVPVALTGCWGVDTNERLTEEQYVKLWTYDLRAVSWACRRASPEAPVFPDFIGRYGPLYGNGVGTDLTSGELVVATQTGQRAGRKGVVVMFQHVRRGEEVNGVDIGWIPTDEMGLQDAQTIVGYADAIGFSVAYAADFDGPQLVPHLIQDLENVRAGHSTLGMSHAWRDFVASAKRVQPAAYNGFNPGLSAQQFADLNVPIAKDTGPRPTPPGRGTAYEQHEWVTIPDVGKFDIAYAHSDETGTPLIGIGYVPDPVAPTEPAPPPEGNA